MTLGRTHKLRVYHHFEDLVVKVNAASRTVDSNRFVTRAHLSFTSKDSICSSDEDMAGLMKTGAMSDPLLASIFHKDGSRFTPLWIKLAQQSRIRLGSIAI